MMARSCYREWVAPPSLRHAIACLWTRTLPGDEEDVALILPDGCADLIWHRDKGGFVAGPDTGPAPTVIEPGALLVGLRFLPGAAGAALGASMHELRDERVAAVEVDGDLARRLPPGLSAQQALERIGRIAEDLVAARPPDDLVVHATSLLTGTGVRLGDVERAVGLGERQLRRRFHSAVGYGPKTLARILRFRRFLSQLGAEAGERPDLVRLAFDSGYADQSHLTRETTRLSGLSPTRLAGLRL
jgi:AraC-like DNA-binding protein